MHHGVTITVINALILHNERKRAKGKEVVRHADFITDTIDSAKTFSDVMKAVSNIRKSLVITGKKTSLIPYKTLEAKLAQKSISVLRFLQCNCYSLSLYM
jgi:hypothetical protein